MNGWLQLDGGIPTRSAQLGTRDGELSIILRRSNSFSWRPKSRYLCGRDDTMPHKGLILGNHAAPARLAATITTLIGLAALAGWAFHLPALSRVLPGGA